jgi:hypothetical protein
MYVFIMLQGLVDRAEVFGTNFAGKIDFINPLLFDKKYINLIRDAELEIWLSDGRPSWVEYKRKNADTIRVGSRVLIDHVFSLYRENPKKHKRGSVCRRGL